MLRLPVTERNMPAVNDLAFQQCMAPDCGATYGLDEVLYACRRCGALLEGKALVGAHGYGCEPASGASVAGLRLLLEERVIAPLDRAVCILTGHQLKDPDVTVNYHRGSRDGTGSASFSNPPLQCAADIDAIANMLGA